MSERGNQLLETADRQIGELIGLVSRGSEADLSRPCRGRDKLGNGTVGALASHTADSYLRIAAFLKATIRMLPGPTPSRYAEEGQHAEACTEATTWRGKSTSGAYWNGYRRDKRRLRCWLSSPTSSSTRCHPRAPSDFATGTGPSCWSYPVR